MLFARIDKISFYYFKKNANVCKKLKKRSSIKTSVFPKPPKSKFRKFPLQARGVQTASSKPNYISSIFSICLHVLLFAVRR